MCDSYNGGSTPWTGAVGTSASCPQWAALIAIIDQGRAAKGLSSLSTAQTQQVLYSLSSADYHDVTIGVNAYGDKAKAAMWARELLRNAPDRPAVEVPMLREQLYARADAMVPIDGGYALRETKASTFPLKNDNVTPGAAHAHHLDDVAIQAWVMEASGLDCARVELNLLNNQWRYPGGDDYRGLFRQLDVTGLLSERRAQVPIWLKAAQEVVAGPMPSALTGKQCSDPYD